MRSSRCTGSSGMAKCCSSPTRARRPHCRPASTRPASWRPAARSWGRTPTRTTSTGMWASPSLTGLRITAFATWRACSRGPPTPCSTSSTLSTLLTCSPLPRSALTSSRSPSTPHESPTSSHPPALSHSNQHHSPYNTTQLRSFPSPSGPQRAAPSTRPTMHTTSSPLAGCRESATTTSSSSSLGGKTDRRRERGGEGRG
mmetsp:Transcript_38584/g.110374  ORF Transcript_38584/g.110374 Transcript_38584/m.110374 type:complete len:200 (-) Transcript_38584:7-606(-)